jgi:hypothetical protein
VLLHHDGAALGVRLLYFYLFLHHLSNNRQKLSKLQLLVCHTW